MKSFLPAVHNIRSFTPAASEVFVARVAASGPKRLRQSLTVRTRAWRLRPTIRGAGAEKRGKAAVELHVATSAKNGDVRGLVVSGVVVPMVPICSGDDPTAFTRPEPILSLRAIPLRERLGRVPLPSRVIGPSQYWLVWTGQVMPPLAHRLIVCQRCHIYQRHARETRARRRAASNHDLFGVRA